ncbi:MAG: dihydroneopterin aldolase [Firmicutes bacterium]|nr:dihydroneopterin aldolase [Bacillota bacterium]
MADWIRLRGMRFQSRHGALRHEKEFPQEYRVDVGLEVDLAVAGTSDRLADTVDYTQVVAAVQDILDGPSRNLLETLAESIAARLLQWPQVKTATVRVRKMAPPLPVVLDWAEVEVERRRGEGR